MATAELPKNAKHIETGDIYGGFTPEQSRFLFRNFDLIKALLQDGVTQDVLISGTTLQIRHGIIIGVV